MKLLKCFMLPLKLLYEIIINFVLVSVLLAGLFVYHRRFIKNCKHDFKEWISDSGIKHRTCNICETEQYYNDYYGRWRGVLKIRLWKRANQ
jgi:hypothetical protein